LRIGKCVLGRRIEAQALVLNGDLSLRRQHLVQIVEGGEHPSHHLYRGRPVKANLVQGQPNKVFS
jgi:hypothetical protein